MNSVASVLKAHVNAALAFIYPEVCQICGDCRASLAECYICADCRNRVRFIEPPFCDRCGFPFEGKITTVFECSKCQSADWQFSHARSSVAARDPILEVIHRYKYQHALWFEPFLAELLIERARPGLAGSRWDWIVPVPLHPTKQREREFNQAERLAGRLRRAIDVPVNTKLLRRRVATRTQTLLSREERLENVRGAFVPKERTRLEGQRIILIDDVFTTGATTGACAKVLRALGASEVYVWTVARGI